MLQFKQPEKQGTIMTTLILNSQFKQFGTNGEPLAAGKIYTYVVGTTTPKVTYQDKAKTAAHTNPIILDSWGEATIWIDGDTKFVVTDSDDVTIRTYASFADTGATETPIVPSPMGGVFRSESTETGYIKITLPMDSWPDTKINFDVIIYDDNVGESTVLNLSGYAELSGATWENVTALSLNNSNNYLCSFGNDGSKPSIYISQDAAGASSSWTKPQVAVSNLLAGGTNYDWETWFEDWEITVTTNLGTITQTATTQVWGEWQEPTLENSWTNPFPTTSKVRYRIDPATNNIQITGTAECPSSSVGDITIFTTATGFRPPGIRRSAVGTVSGATETISVVSLNSDGYLRLAGADMATGKYVYIECILALD